MIEVYKNLFIGNEIDFERNVKQQPGWIIVHACKEPYHRQALGYRGQACAKTHPEYLFALRSNRLFLNLVDVDDPSWVSPIIVDEAIRFLDEGLKKGQKALVHCNQGMSRSAGLGLLYLAHIGQFGDADFVTAEMKYRELYPPYRPAGGIHGFCMQSWDKYRKVLIEVQ
jgi:predicted protein tyrosine phosphatase